jgi:hypothetical protein
VLVVVDKVIFPLTGTAPVLRLQPAKNGRIAARNSATAAKKSDLFIFFPFTHWQAQAFPSAPFTSQKSKTFKALSFRPA